jgi:CheY-like chemotaxis protein
MALLLDLNMPEVDGFEVLDYFQANELFDKIPVCIITGDVEKERIDRASLPERENPHRVTSICAGNAFGTLSS